MLEELGNIEDKMDSGDGTAELIRHAYWMGYLDADRCDMEDPRFGPVPRDRGLKTKEVMDALRGGTPKLRSGSSPARRSTTTDRLRDDQVDYTEWWND